MTKRATRTPRWTLAKRKDNTVRLSGAIIRAGMRQPLDGDAVAILDLIIERLLQGYDARKLIDVAPRKGSSRGVAAIGLRATDARGNRAEAL